MASNDLLNTFGLRLDGRSLDQLRQMHCRLGLFARADGSAYLEQGNTQVVATVYGPREKSRGGGSADVHDDEQAFGAIKTELYPRSRIDIYVQVLQSDGGSGGSDLNTAINAVTLALMNAGISLHDYICAASAGLSNVPKVDEDGLSSSLTAMVEISQCDLQGVHGVTAAQSPAIDLAVQPNSDGAKPVVWLDMGRGIGGLQRMHIDHLDDILTTAISAAGQLHEDFDVQVRKHVHRLASKSSFGFGQTSQNK